MHLQVLWKRDMIQCSCKRLPDSRLHSHSLFKSSSLALIALKSLTLRIVKRAKKKLVLVAFLVLSSLRMMLLGISGLATSPTTSISFCWLNEFFS